MILRPRRALLRDPQAGVPFRPWMLAHGGSISELAPHRVARLEEAGPGRRSTLLPWTTAMAGIMAAFFLGSSWSAPPGPQTGDVCLATVPEAAAAPARESPALR
jgi:hypothetical protein